MRIFLSLLAVLLTGSAGSAQAEIGPATMLADVRAQGVSSFPSRLLSTPGAMYFDAADSLRLPGLWRTDGTHEGTHRLKVGRIARAAAVIEADAGERVLFMIDAAGTYELWATDRSGTEDTQLVSFGPNLTSPDLPSSLLAVGDQAYFEANDGVHGRELWVSDGTIQGTHMVRDLALGAASAIPIGGLGPLALGSAVLFLAASEDNEAAQSSLGLWSSDGTAQGTHLIKAGFMMGNSLPFRSFNARELAYFEAEHVDEGWGLWASDGTPTGTQLVLPYFLLHKEFNAPKSGYSVTESGVLVAGTTRAPDQPATQGLWWIDGKPGHQLSRQPYFTIYDSATLGNRTFLAACEGIDRGPCGLWQTHGAADVELIIELPFDDLYFRPCNDYGERANPRFTVANNALFFVLKPQDRDFELWRSDGTARGTQRLLGGFDYVGETASSGPRLAFVANDGSHGIELWVSDGSVEGTVLLDIASGTLGGAHNLHRTREYAYAVSPVNGCIEQVVSMNIESGAFEPLQSVGVGRNYEGPAVTFLTTFMEDLFFAVDWFFAGTDGLRRVSATAASTTILHPGGIRAIWATHRNLYFTDAGDVLWRMASQSNDVIAVEAAIHPISDLAETDDRLLIISENESVDLWASRGLPQTAQRIRLIGQQHYVSGSLTTSGEIGHFTTMDEQGSAVLWRIEGSAAGTRSIARFERQAESDPAPHNLAATQQFLFFTLTTDDLGRELWRFDETTATTTLVRDLNPGSGSGAGSVAVMGDVVYFVGDDGERGAELWRSDGSEFGTQLVADINPGAGSGLRRDDGELFVVNGMLVFSADDGVSGEELWRSDGTAAGTFRIQDIAPGPRSSRPTEITFAGAYMTFIADDAVHGREVWRMPMAALDQSCAGDCNRDFQVTIEEMVRAVAVAVGNAPLTSCLGSGWNHDNPPNMNELKSATANAILTCSFQAPSGPSSSLRRTD